MEPHLPYLQPQDVDQDSLHTPLKRYYLSVYLPAYLSGGRRWRSRTPSGAPAWRSSKSTLQGIIFLLAGKSTTALTAFMHLTAAGTRASRRAGRHLAVLFAGRRLASAEGERSTLRGLQDEALAGAPWTLQLNVMVVHEAGESKTFFCGFICILKNDELTTEQC